MINNPPTVGAFIPTTQIWDVDLIYSLDVKSPEFKELLVRMYQNINIIALNVNIRDAGYYDLQEFVNGQLYFPDPLNNSTTPGVPDYRPVFRKVINFGSLPNGGTKSVPHNLDVNVGTTFTRIYATASDTTDFEYIPIPYASAGGDNIELSVDATNVNITTVIDDSNFNVCYVVLEYLKF